MGATLHKVTTLAASRVIYFFSVRDYATFRQHSDIVVYLSPT